MSTERIRASWNSTLEKGLVDILHEHNQPRFQAQNAWIPDGWRSIVNKFNEMFPYAYFSKQQIQEKEKELKANYKIIKNARKESGLGWNDSLGMIVAEKPVWDRLLLVRFFSHSLQLILQNKNYIFHTNYVFVLYSIGSPKGQDVSHQTVPSFQFFGISVRR